MVDGAVTVFEPDGTPVLAMGLIFGGVVIDVAPDASAMNFALAAPGARPPESPDSQSFRTLAEATVNPEDSGHCFGFGTVPPVAQPEIVAVTRLPNGQILAQSLEPAVLMDVGLNVVADRGHTLFHRDAGRGIACASCHPEAGDDGHTRLFEGQGLRRTQPLAGGLKGTAPFHWGGELSSFDHLMDEVMVRRMGGKLESSEDAAGRRRGGP